MKIYKELDLNTFEAWSGAVDTLDRVKEENKIAELEDLLDEVYPDGMDETQLNDLLWFDNEWIYESLDIRYYDQVERELTEARIELDDLIDRHREECVDENGDDLDDDERLKIWEDNYKEEAEELEELIKELEEELETL